MVTEKRNGPGTLRRFLLRTVPGRILHLLINAAVIAQLIRMDWRYAWAADGSVGEASSGQIPVAEQLLPLSVKKNQPLGSGLTLEGHSLVPDADPNASFTWFGPFPTITALGISFFSPEGLHTLTLFEDGLAGPSTARTLAVDVVTCFDLTARAKPGKVDLTWPLVPEAQHYAVYRSSVSDPDQFAKIGETAIGVFADWNIPNELTYLYVVGAVGPEFVCYSSVAAVHPTALRDRLNHSPVIYSTPIQNATRGVLYNYDVNAADPDGDPTIRPGLATSTLQYRLSTSPPQMSIDSASGLISWMPESAGTVDVKVVAEDGKGGSDAQTYQVIVAALNTAPIADAGDDQTVLITQTVTLDGSQSSDADGDPLTWTWSLVEVPVGSTAALSDIHAVKPTFTADKPGPYVAQLIVNDGHVDSAPDTVKVTANLPPEQTQIQADLANDTGSSAADKITSDPTVAGKVDGLQNISKFLGRLDGGNPDPFDLSADLQSDGSFVLNTERLSDVFGAPLPDGLHTLHLQTLDSAGQVNASLNLSFVLDRAAPETTIQDRPPSLTLETSAQFTFTGADELTEVALLTFECRLNGGAFTVCESPATFATLGGGQHSFEVRAIDLAGNSDPTPAIYPWVIDLVLPDTTITTAPPLIAGGTSATFEFAGSDNVTSPAELKFECRLDGEAFTECASPQNLSSLPDGAHTFEVRAIDTVGHVDPTPATHTWTVDTLPPPLTLTLDPLFDSAPLGDLETTFAVVKLIGQTEPNFLVTLKHETPLPALSPSDGERVASGRVRGTAVGEGERTTTTTSDESGNFTFANVALILGPNSFTVQVADAAGNSTTAPLTITRIPRPECLFEADLRGWTVTESGGSAPGKGSVVAEKCEAIMTEGDSFLVTLERTFEVPATPSALTFTYRQLNFDQTAANRIKDAFEAALVDALGQPLVFAITPGRDAFFNASDGQPIALASGVSQSEIENLQSQITIDLSHLAAGSAIHLILRLINNDADASTRVHITDVRFVPSVGTRSTASPINPPPVGQNIDFSALSDVSSSTAADYGQTSFNESTDHLFTYVSIRNTGSYEFRAPLIVVIRNLSDPSVRVLNADGLTSEGLPYFDFSALIPSPGGEGQGEGDHSLNPQQSTLSRTLTFSNPNRTPFTYELTVLSQLNRAPAFTSTPVIEALVGKPYSYTVTATDPDRDALAFALVTGPVAAEVTRLTSSESAISNPQSAILRWTPTANDIGSHNIRLHVEDGRGGSAEQHYLLNVISPPPNRPPVFTSLPVVSIRLNSNRSLVAAAVFLSGHDPDLHVISGANVAGARRITQTSIQFAMDPVYNPYAKAGVKKFLLVGAKARLPFFGGYHTEEGFIATGYQPGLDFDLHDYETLESALAQLGTVYSAIVVSSQAGLPEQKRDLEVLNRNAQVVIDFLNSGGGLVAFTQASSLGDAEPEGGYFGFLPFVVSSALLTQEELGTVTEFGQSLGLTDSDVTGNFSHNIFLETSGLTIVDYDSARRIISLAGRGSIVTGGVVQAEGYFYDSDAIDPDGDRVTFALTVFPEGMTISPSTGLILWVPTASQIGNHNVAVQVSDGRGGTATQSYVISVLPDPANHAPIIISEPSTSTVVNKPYSYDVDALDPDGDQLTYLLALSPTGMSINPNTGLIQWTPDGTPGSTASPFRLGSSQQDIGAGVATDSAGNAYLCGHFSGTVDFDPGPGSTTLTSLGDEDVYVAKYNFNGSLIWARRAGNTAQDRSYALTVDALGNVYVIGLFRGTVDFDPGPGPLNVTAVGDSDAFVWKLDSTGALAWVRVLQGTGPDAAWGAVALDGAGDVYLSGEFSGTADFDPGPATYLLTARGGGDIFIWKLDNSGNFRWARRAGGTGRDTAWSLALDTAGNVYTTGIFNWQSSSEKIDFDPGPGVFELSGSSQSFVWKLSTTGDFVFARQFPGARNEVVSDATGNTYSLGDGEIRKLDPEGNDLWTKSYAGETGHGLAIDRDGNVYSHGGVARAHLAKLSPSGDVLWARSYGGPGSVIPYRLALDSRGTVRSTGWFSGTVDFGAGIEEYNLSSAGGNDIFQVAFTLAGEPILRKSHVTVRVDDGRGGFDTQRFTINVLDQPPAPQVDLTVEAVNRTGLSVDPQTLAAAGTVSATVKNLGPNPATQPFDVLFFEDVNHNSAYDAGADTVLGKTTVSSPLAAGASREVSASVGAQVSFPGIFVWAFVDSGNTVAESNEGNNLARNEVHCQYIPPVGQFNPVIEWKKDTFSVIPDSKQVSMSPAVTDINGDGIPDIVFSTFPGVDGDAGFRDGTLRAISGADGRDLWTVSNRASDVAGGAGIAIGDIDADGLSEIVAVHESTSLIAFENDGAFKWLSSTPVGVSPHHSSGNLGAPAIADLDHDGVPEIVFGSMVFDNSGHLLWKGSTSGGTGDGDNAFGALSIVADLDLDGWPEIVAGKTAYRRDGSVYWNSTLTDGFPAVANFDEDPYTEIALVTQGNLYLLEHSGEVKWGPVAIPGGGPGGPPTIADLDGDGQPEIGVAGAVRYVVFEADGSIKWQAETRDTSSRATGSTVFDFEGDGKAEVLYGDELFLRIYDGATGNVLYSLPKSSCTAYEYPVVADVDGDGNAEIITVANQACGYGPDVGLWVIGDANDTWVPTRQIWNQHSYHISNVNDDGTIPRFEANSWQTHNTYRLNLQPEANGGPHAAPDLMACFLRVAVNGQNTTITARIGNGGELLVGPGINVGFYNGDPRAGGTLLGVTPTT
ncbi:MAG: putative Ig domain-containing protein, partial [Verrucomicrobiales bacterium]|nr:putative Ig domain-containing protein [Verrucomicrobiales bacterium]